MKNLRTAALLLIERWALTGAIRLTAVATWARSKAGPYLSLLLVGTAVASLRMVSAAILVSPVILMGAML
jgi:hypothetical protein